MLKIKIGLGIKGLLNIEDEIADTDSLEYFYASGKGATINGETYIKDERGNIYNTTLIY